MTTELEAGLGTGEQTPITSEKELVVEPTPLKPVEPPSKGEKPTPVFTQKDYDKALTKAKSKIQSARDREFAEKEKEVAELQKRIGETELAIEEKAFRDKWTEAGIDETEIKSFQEARRELKQAKRDFDTQKTTYEGYFAKVQEIEKGQKATQLASEYGVDEKELLKAQNPDEMEKIAKDLRIVKLQERVEELEKAPEKIDSSLPSATGERSFKRLEQDYADGKVSTAEYEKALREQGKI